MQQQFNAVYERDGEWWVASAVEVPGAFSQGKTIDEARENLLDAVRELILAQRQLMEAELVDKEVVRESLSLDVE